ncbi:MAG TPA: TerB family tellurite resistance protein [Burkholderiales bacterium]|nr:TerB family tellurite resistance protein [Burkholderiales bacterium]
MLKALKRAFATAQSDHALPGHERRQLHLAVAVLLHEAGRADYVESDAESAAAHHALTEILSLDPKHAAELLTHAREKAQQLTSFYAPVSVIKREFSLDERTLLVEHLWRIAFAEGGLDQYEDHYVRKIAHLLYVPNTQCMLARNRARAKVSEAT